MDFERVQEKVLTAIERLVESDAHLLEVDVNERSITHWLAVHLCAPFAPWHVDCEYNRNETDTKRLRLCERGEQWPDCIELPVDELGAVRPDDIEGRTVYPDIIVHERGTGNNLLVIEVKKTLAADESSFDMQKLQAYVIQLDYAYGLFLQLGIDRRAGLGRSTWILDHNRRGETGRFDLRQSLGLGDSQRALH
jgi:hypothetical protein